MAPKNPQSPLGVMPRRDEQRDAVSQALRNKKRALAIKKQLGDEAHKKEVDDKDNKTASDDDNGDNESDPIPGQMGYIATTILALFFTTLPMGEEVVDWKIVAVFAVFNAVWIPFIHRASFLHYMTFFLFNVLVVQVGPYLDQVPEYVAAIDPWLAGGFITVNAFLLAAIYYVYVRHLKPRRRADAWDWILTIAIIANVLVLIAMGAIPAAVVYHVFRTLVGLLTNFSISH